MEKTVEQLLLKLEKSGENKSKETLKECLLDFLEYLKNKKETFSINSFPKEKKYQHFSEVNDYDEYGRINLSMAFSTLDNLIEKIRIEGISYYNILKYKEYIKVIIYDLRSTMDFLHQNDTNFTFLNDSYPILNSPIRLRSAVDHLLFPFKNTDTEHKYLDNISIATVIIRQIIEVRLKRFFGIWSVRKKEKCTDFSYAKLIEFIEQNNNSFIHKIDLVSLKTIYKWSCNCIHNGVRPYIWQVDHAIIEIDDLFKPSSISNKEGFYWSADGALIIKDYERIKDKIKNQFNKCYEFKFIKPDALTI